MICAVVGAIAPTAAGAARTRPGHPLGRVKEWSPGDGCGASVTRNTAYTPDRCACQAVCQALSTPQLVAPCALVPEVPQQDGFERCRKIYSRPCMISFPADS